MRAARLLALPLLVVAAPAVAQSVTNEELQAALRQRDAVIAALEQRITALEAQKAVAASQPMTTYSAPAGTTSVAATAPSTAKQDEEAELEALSRGLVQRGLVLLPRGSLEIAPALAYSHSQQQGLVLVDTPEGISTVESQRQRDDSIDGALTLRYGLPLQSQIQVRVPYSWRRRQNALGDGTLVSNSTSSIGDVELELAHQFISERGGLPGVTAAVAWRIPTGQDPLTARVASVAVGTGTHQVSGRVTAIKSIDPLVLFTTLSYSANFAKTEKFGRVDPGDSIDWSLGGILAVSPETTLNFGLLQQFRDRTRVDGTPIQGSDGVAAIAQFGIDQVLGSRALLAVSFGIGLTNDAPDYQLLVSAPIRFR